MPGTLQTKFSAPKLALPLPARRETQRADKPIARSPWREGVQEPTCNCEAHVEDRQPPRKVRAFQKSQSYRDVWLDYKQGHLHTPLPRTPLQVSS